MHVPVDQSGHDSRASGVDLGETVASVLLRQVRLVADPGDLVAFDDNYATLHDRRVRLAGQDAAARDPITLRVVIHRARPSEASRQRWRSFGRLGWHKWEVLAAKRLADGDTDLVVGVVIGVAARAK